MGSRHDDDCTEGPRDMEGTRFGWVQILDSAGILQRRWFGGMTEIVGVGGVVEVEMEGSDLETRKKRDRTGKSERCGGWRDSPQQHML